jgi:hypothetical protein
LFHFRNCRKVVAELMAILAAGLAAVGLWLAPASATAKSYSFHPYGHSSIRCIGCPRDSHGHIRRSPQAKRSFRSSHPCPSTGRTRGACPGYEVDHRQPLFKGGTDSPSNMEWLTKEQHRAKTRRER